jgi:hypothetical protein
MARWATLVEIAGVSLTGCRAEILNGEGFHSAYVGSNEFANDGDVHTQVVNRGTKGILFGIKFVSTQSSDLADILSAIQTAQAARVTFNVKINDGLYSVDHACNPDYSQQWLAHGEHSEGWYQDVTFRFVTKG